MTVFCCHISNSRVPCNRIANNPKWPLACSARLLETCSSSSSRRPINDQKKMEPYKSSSLYTKIKF